jgi:hypothetical protein
MLFHGAIAIAIENQNWYAECVFESYFIDIASSIDLLPFLGLLVVDTEQLNLAIYWKNVSDFPTNHMERSRGMTHGLCKSWRYAVAPEKESKAELTRRGSHLAE